MRDIKNIITPKNIINPNKNTKNIQSRKGKSFGYQVLGFGSGGIAASFIVASGGTITCCGDCKVHTFTGDGTFTVCSVGCAAGSTTVDYLVVAGGGAGGPNSTRGGGGGAGGYRVSYPNPATGGLSVCAQDYPITVGGAAANSVFSNITSARGGAGGGSQADGNPGGNGGGGGGGPSGDCTGNGQGNVPPVSPSQGNPGGIAAGNAGAAWNGGGGGGGGCGESGVVIIRFKYQ